MSVTSLALSLAYPYSASADSSCNPLLRNLWQYKEPVSFKWSTHYQSGPNWAVGYTDGYISKPDYLHYTGSGKRLWSNRKKSTCFDPRGEQFCANDQPFNVENPEPVTFDVNGFGLITLLGVYGPYEIKCEGDRFLNVNTGDSIETFSFAPAAEGPH